MARRASNPLRPSATRSPRHERSRYAISTALHRALEFDFSASVAVGAVLGRTAILERPTLVGEALALVTLFVIQLVVDRLVSSPASTTWSTVLRCP